MDAILLVLGFIISGAGLVLLAIGAATAASGLGGTLITTGALAAVGGLILIGLASIIQQLFRLAQALEAWPLPRSIKAESEPLATPPEMPSAIPSSWLTEDPAEDQPPLAAVTEPSQPVRAEAVEPAPPARGNSTEGRGNIFEKFWTDVAPQRGPMARRAAKPAPAAAEVETPALAATAPEPAVDAAKSAKAETILKSGVIDGMAYTLYVDGSIEAELPHGTVRFGSLDELRGHVAKRN